MSTIPEETPRTLGLALAGWALGVTIGSLEGVFEKFSPVELAGLATFAFLFATATTHLDQRVRELLATIRTRSLFTFAIEMDLGLAVAAMLAIGFANGDVIGAVAKFPFAVVVLFVAPVAAVAHVLLIERLLRSRPERSTDVALSR